MSGLVERALETGVLPGAAAAVSGPSAVHAAHADLVWATLQRFGVPPEDLEDAFQDVFIVVQQRLGDFDGGARLSTWLFEICRRVASTHRRRAKKLRERTGETLAEDVVDATSGPERLAEESQAREQLARVLDAMDPDRRAFFVMFEIEEMPCDEIASLAGIPVGTVYSRLHAARKEFARILEEERRGSRGSAGKAGRR